jgi:hypothetical protein
MNEALKAIRDLYEANQLGTTFIFLLFLVEQRFDLSTYSFVRCPSNDSCTFLWWNDCTDWYVAQQSPEMHGRYYFHVKCSHHKVRRHTDLFLLNYALYSHSHFFFFACLNFF